MPFFKPGAQLKAIDFPAFFCQTKIQLKSWKFGNPEKIWQMKEAFLLPLEFRYEMRFLPTNEILAADAEQTMSENLNKSEGERN